MDHNLIQIINYENQTIKKLLWNCTVFNYQFGQFIYFIKVIQRNKIGIPQL